MRFLSIGPFFQGSGSEQINAGGVLAGTGCSDLIFRLRMPFARGLSFSAKEWQ